MGSHSRLEVISSVAFFIVVSLGAVFLNKLLMSSDYWGFSAFLFLTWFQFAVALGCFIVMGELGVRYRLLSFMPRFHIQWNVARSVAPVTLCFCGAIVFTNGCLGAVDVPLFSIVRNMVMIFTVIFSYLILKEKTSLPIIMCCITVLAGYVIGAADKVTFSFWGLALGTVSCVWSALYAVFVKKVLQLLDGSTWKLLMYNSWLAMIMLGAAFFVSSEKSFVMDYPHLNSKDFWALMFLTGFVGFLINIAFFLLVKVTSPLTVNIAGAAKSVAQSLVSTLIFGNVLGKDEAIGLLFCFIGSVFYSVVRNREASRKAVELKEEKDAGEVHVKVLKEASTSVTPRSLKDQSSSELYGLVWKEGKLLLILPSMRFRISKRTLMTLATTVIFGGIVMATYRSNVFAARRMLLPDDAGTALIVA